MSSSIEYASYLIRLWRETIPSPSPVPPDFWGTEGGREEVPDWHGEVEHIQSGRCWTFGSLDGVLAFLRQQAEDMVVLGSSPATPNGLRDSRTGPISRGTGLADVLSQKHEEAHREEQMDNRK